MLTSREFLGEEFWKSCKQDMDELLAFRKTLKGKPDIYDKAQIELNKIFIEFYKVLLFHENSGKCGCPYCAENRELAPIVSLRESKAESRWDLW